MDPMLASGTAVWLGRGQRGECVELRRVSHTEFKVLLVMSVGAVAPTWWAYRSGWRAVMDTVMLVLGGWPRRWDYEARTMRQRTERGDLVRTPAPVMLEP